MGLTFFSTCPESWGGSEELWSAAACALAQRGERVHVYKTGVDERHPKIQHLRRSGLHLHDLDWLIYPPWIRILNKYLLPTPNAYLPEERAARYQVARHLLATRPRLAVVAQGENFDGVEWGALCRRKGVPYVMICQKASDIIWPNDEALAVGREAYAGARNVFFVAEANRRLTESMLGMRLPQARLVRNPVLLRRQLPWPQGPLRLACVARLWAQDKGQDLLFDVLARPHWRDRPLTVSMVGTGWNDQAMRGRVQQLQLPNVRFLGQVQDVEAIWRDHHALILPSRAEGLPLAAVEAMMCGRPCLLTDVGGNRELLSSPEAGILALSASLPHLEEALERFWERREDWQRMGEAAARLVRQFVPGEPVADFLEQLS